MHVINILSNSVVDKIAAGEVVERPASVVKELVENSIDASATAITVEIKQGGKKLIRVTDNGIGIPKSEVKKAFIRHATSKIETEEDLNSIISLGFRGEALASIVAVSKFEMLTKVKEDVTGKRVVVEGGEIKVEEEVGITDGTTVVVNELFYNVPARMKFLKSDTTEATEINEIVNKLSLTHPEISFKFINNGKVLLHTTGSKKLINAIFSVYGKEITNDLVELNSEDNEIRVTGYIGKTNIQRATRIYENFFVNGRYIKSQVLSEALEEAYYGYIMKGKFPFCMLNVQIEPELIDVNVHPAKTEIKFKNEELVYNTLLDCIKKKLKELDNAIDINLSSKEEEKINRNADYKTKLMENQNAMDASMIENPKVSYKPKASSSILEQLYGNKKSLEEIKSKYSKEDELVTTDIISEVFEQAKIEGIIEERKEEYKAEDNKVKETYENETLNTMPIRNYKIIGQLFKTYFLIEQEDELYMIDQHAAQEKIFYERLKNDYENINVNTQVLLENVILELTPKELEVVNKYIDSIRKFGFNIEPFGDNSFKISEVPFIFENPLTEQMFKEMIDELLDKKFEKDMKTFDDMFATICCKKAIKANDRQSLQEGEQIIKDLMSLENPFNCPHGRPVIIRISKDEIERKFKRII